MASVIICILVLSVAFTISPEGIESSVLGWLPTCPAKLAGSSCFSCGLTHSVSAAAHRQWSRSLEFHAAGIPTFFLALANALTGQLYLIRLIVRKKRRGQ
ncbi:MAG: DUF2752 domain-containing protein [Acidobacteriota bacterium]